MSKHFVFVIEEYLNTLEENSDQQQARIEQQKLFHFRKYLEQNGLTVSDLENVSTINLLDYVDHLKFITDNNTLKIVQHIEAIHNFLKFCIKNSYLDKSFWTNQIEEILHNYNQTTR